MQRPSEKRNRVTPIPTAGQRAGGVANARTTPQNYTTAHPRNAEYASTRGRFEARTVQNRAPADQRLYRSQIRRSTLSRKDDQSARIVGRGTRTVPTRTTGTAGPLPTTTPIFKGCKHHHIVDPMTRHTRKWVAASSIVTGIFTDDHRLREHCSQGHHRTRRGHEAQQTHIDIRYRYVCELVQIGRHLLTVE
jgi:hypothetical protein